MLKDVVTMIAATVPLTTLNSRSNRSDDALLLLLYIGTVAGVLAWLCLPTIEWEPTTGSLFGVDASQVE